MGEGLGPAVETLIFHRRLEEIAEQLRIGNP
jgi:hypothetical protein